MLIITYMTAELIPSRKGGLSRVAMDKGERVSCVAEFLDLMANCPSDTIILRKDDIAEEFYDLKTGLAGEILQKVSNYRRRLAVLGDFDSVKSRALRDFIRESNGTGKVVFTADLEAAVALLK